MHLCIITSSYPTAPDDIALPFMPWLVRAIEARHHRVSIVTPDRRRAPDVSPPGVIWSPWLGGQRSVASLDLRRPDDVLAAAHFLSSCLASVLRLHARAPVDHVLAAFVVPAGAVALALRVTRGVPYSVWALGSEMPARLTWGPIGLLTRLVLRSADQRFANSHTLSDRVRHVAGRECSLLLCARPLPEPEPVPVDPNRRNLLFLGRLERVKGIDLLLEAFGAVAKRVPDLDLHVVGDGALRGRVEEAATRAALGRIHVHGSVGPGQVAGFLARCDLLVVPSRSESLPGVLLEAARAGLPVVATRVGDVPRFVEEHALGDIVPTDHPTALADALVSRLATGPSRSQPRVSLATADPDATAERLLAALGASV